MLKLAKSATGKLGKPDANHAAEHHGRPSRDANETTGRDRLHKGLEELSKLEHLPFHRELPSAPPEDHEGHGNHGDDDDDGPAFHGARMPRTTAANTTGEFDLSN
jgi:hypothetical protein